MINTLIELENGFASREISSGWNLGASAFITKSTYCNLVLKVFYDSMRKCTKGEFFYVCFIRIFQVDEHPLERLWMTYADSFLLLILWEISWSKIILCGLYKLWAGEFLWKFLIELSSFYRLLNIRLDELCRDFKWIVRIGYWFVLDLAIGIWTHRMISPKDDEPGIEERNRAISTPSSPTISQSTRQLKKIGL